MAMSKEDVYQIERQIAAGMKVREICRGDMARETAYYRAVKRMNKEKEAALLPPDTSKLLPPKEIKSTIPAGRGEEEEKEEELNLEGLDESPDEQARRLEKEAIVHCRKNLKNPSVLKCAIDLLKAKLPEYKEKSTKRKFTPEDYAKALDDLMGVKPNEESEEESSKKISTPMLAALK